MAGHGVVTLPLLGVWGWFLSEQQERKHCSLPKEYYSRKNREWGTKCSFTLLCLPGRGNTGGEAVAAFQGGVGTCSLWGIPKLIPSLV